MKVLAFIISILLLSFSTSAQVYIGSVVDKETSEALIGANIQFVSESDTIYSTTDEMGAYSFSTPKKTGASNDHLPWIFTSQGQLEHFHE